MDTYNEKEIIALLQDPKRQREAFECIVKQYSEQLYWQIRRMVLSHDDANDLLQNTFIKAWINIDYFRAEAKMSTWLYRIAYNRAAGECRRRAYDRIDAESCAVAEESSAGRFDEETVVRMRRALERLRPDERVLVALFYEEERSLAEIAQIMNLTLSNVKVRLHRLRGRLRHYMEE